MLRKVELQVNPVRLSLAALAAALLTFSVERLVKKRFEIPNSISFVSATASE